MPCLHLGEIFQHLLWDFDFFVALEKTEASGLGSPLLWLSSSRFLSDVSLARWSRQQARFSPPLLIFLRAHNSQGQTFPCNAEADKSNLSSKQVILLQNLTKKGEGHFPWLGILSYFESKLTECLSLWFFFSRQPKGKKRRAFCLLLNIPISSLSQTTQKTLPLAFISLNLA